MVDKFSWTQKDTIGSKTLKQIYATAFHDIEANRANEEYQALNTEGIHDLLVSSFVLAAS